MWVVAPRAELARAVLGVETCGILRLTGPREHATFGRQECPSPVTAQSHTAPPQAVGSLGVEAGSCPFFAVFSSVRGPFGALVDALQGGEGSPQVPDCLPNFSFRFLDSCFSGRP